VPHDLVRRRLPGGASHPWLVGPQHGDPGATMRRVGYRRSVVRLDREPRALKRRTGCDASGYWAYQGRLGLSLTTADPAGPHMLGCVAKLRPADPLALARFA
jgi:hypothetical protein